jgi:tRNA threonylcarbamoyladenosine biosynthesis protein TsaB
MKVLGIDTATQRCSVALRMEGRSIERAVDTVRGHAEMLLPMVEEVLREAGLALKELDGIAYGRGPGAFTGVRVTIGVVQGLAFGAQLPTVGISNLAAVAQQVAKPSAKVLVCMDARMSEVYWGVFEADARGIVGIETAERVSSPEEVRAEAPSILAGTGFAAYTHLQARFKDVSIHEDVLPHAREIAALGELELRAGRGRPAAQAQPKYLRDRVTFVKEM